MLRLGRSRSLVASIVLGVVLLLAPSEARAETEDDFDTADGVKGCRDFIEANERELAQWEAEQPPVPYKYPREKKWLHAPWPRFFGTIGSSGELLLATLLPHVGAQFRGDAPAAYVSWPWSFVLDPPFSCSRKKGTFVVHGHRAHRVLVEPAVVSSKRGIGVSVRPGYRFVYHPTSWVVGPGAGLGTTIDIQGNREPFRFSVSPEAALRFGQCCRPSYFMLAVRYDHYFAGTVTDIVGASLGYTFF